MREELEGGREVMEGEGEETELLEERCGEEKWWRKRLKEMGKVRVEGRK